MTSHSRSRVFSADGWVGWVIIIVCCTWISPSLTQPNQAKPSKQAFIRSSSICSPQARSTRSFIHSFIHRPPKVLPIPSAQRAQHNTSQHNTTEYGRLLKRRQTRSRRARGLWGQSSEEAKISWYSFTNYLLLLHPKLFSK